MGSSDKHRLRELKSSNNTVIALWGLSVVLGIFLCIVLLYTVIAFEDDPKFDCALRPNDKVTAVIPSRGDILDCRNRVLATSTIVYDVHFDPVAVCDTLWDNNIVALAHALEKHIGGKDASTWLHQLRQARSKESRYVLIKKGISQISINEIRRMPIFKAGKNKGGYLEESYMKRLYPYGTSARRTIGYVRNNNDSTSKKIGIEGGYDELLHGTNGVQVMSRSDLGMIPVYDSRNKKSKDGKSIRTTIDIDIQNIADEALRKMVESNELIEKSCVIILDSETGAVKAMVNLGRDINGYIGEWDNYALRTAEAPGSVFKGAVVMAMLEEGYIKTLEHKIPTYGGRWTYKGLTYEDYKHLNKARFPSGYIKVREAFEMSANNPFRQLICNEKTFGNNNMRFINKIKGFGLLDTLDFDIKGNTPPFILDPTMTKPGPKGFWDNGTFPRMAIGYNMELSALNIVTFYNAIANNGTVMKPYLIDAVLDGKGKVEQQFNPIVLHERICTQSTVDTLKRAMSNVTKSKGGTAYWQLHNAICPIAGKTGTAQRVFKMSNGRYGYHDFQTGAESQQGTFVGFFPVEKPKYTGIVVVWCKPAVRNFYGATYAAPVFKEIADKIYCLNED